MSQGGLLRVRASILPPSVPTSFVTNAGTAVPALNILNILANTTAAGVIPIRTTGAGNTVTVVAQISQAIAATDATKIGLSNFNLAQFTVDANGFVSTSGTGVGNTITGNSGGTLSPTAGNWNIFGGSTAAGTSPVSTSGAVSTLTVNVQKSQAIAATDATKVGLSNYNSTQFSVDANGFVTSNNFTITAGTGLTGGGTITLGGSVTLNSTGGGFTWVDVTTATQTLAAQTGYVTDRSGGVTYTLPASGTLGDTIKIVGKLGLATITPNSNQQILIGSASGTVGVTGTAVSNNVGDCIELICITAGASTVWRANSVVGTWTLN